MSNPDPTRRRNAILGAFVCFVLAGLVAVFWYFSPSPAPTTEAAAPEEAPAPVPQPETVVAPLKPKAKPAVKVVKKKEPPAPTKTLVEGWGIEFSSARLSMANSIVDVRYKVLDPVKVANLARLRTPAYIVDEETGKKLIMPSPPKEGAFPPTGNKLEVGKTYFTMVSNPGGALKSGSKVRIVIGDSQATSLAIE